MASEKLTAGMAKLAAGKAVVDLSNAGIGDEEVAKVADALAGNATCKWLLLAGNKITDVGLGRLVEALCGNTTMTYLGLSNNQITDGGARSLAEMLRGNTTMTMLGLNSKGEVNLRGLVFLLLVAETKR